MLLKTMGRDRIRSEPEPHIQNLAQKPRSGGGKIEGRKLEKGGLYGGKSLLFGFLRKI